VKKKNLRTKITGISSLAGTEPDILLGGGSLPPSPPFATYVMKNTLAIGGLKLTIHTAIKMTKDIRLHTRGHRPTSTLRYVTLLKVT